MKQLLVSLTLAGLFSVSAAADSYPLLSDIEIPPSLLQNYDSKTADACIEADLNRCQQLFNDELGIMGNADWTDSAQLEYALNRIMFSSEGVPGLLRVCSARSHFYQCLGTAYSDCISTLHFVQDGIDISNAYNYVRLFKELEFTCDGGILQGIRRWDCIVGVRMNPQNNQTFNQCIQNFNTSVWQDPNNFCQSAQGLTTCLKFPFIRTCGGQVGWWECERVRVSFQAVSYCPTLTCHINSKSAEDGEERAALPPINAWESHTFNDKMMNFYMKLSAEAYRKAHSLD